MTKRLASWNSPWGRPLLLAAEDAAENSKLWCGAAVLMACTGGGRGRKAAAAGLGSLTVAQVLSNAVCKQLYERRRPPVEWIPHPEVHERPDSSSFPSGHTAAAVAFTAAVAPVWPWAGGACGVVAAMVAAQRVHSGAHYPSDVAAGALIGLAAAALVRNSPRLLLRLAL
ncbi:phosphatase PAP2 family protein [Streptomyces ficellus]|uniref:phosphatase PAP2 family protein n=1 Tax=Streptomyces ficellus TaxID=1977088 RepID=UPI00338F5F82